MLCAGDGRVTHGFRHQYGVLGFAMAVFIRMPSAPNSSRRPHRSGANACVNNQRNFGDSFTQNSQR